MRTADAVRSAHCTSGGTIMDCASFYSVDRFFLISFSSLPVTFLQQCALRSQEFAIYHENSLDLKIQTGADPHSVRTLYGKSHVCSMQFSAWGIRRI